MKLEIKAKILPPEDYLWHTYNSNEPMDITTTNGKKTIHMVKGEEFGIRPSTSGSAIRMITKKFGPTIVFTLTMYQKRQLLHKSDAFNKASKKASQFFVDLPERIDVDTARIDLDWKLKGNKMEAEIDEKIMDKVDTICSKLPFSPEKAIKDEILDQVENPENIKIKITWKQFEPAYVEVFPA
jgi:hypothetical protein